MTPKDNFSKQAQYYARFRPHYPKELYEYLYSQLSHFNTAWDCGTGNGQVASVLSDKFNKVYASDISKNQLSKAVPRENIEYFIAPAEQTNIPSGTVDLITVAQALHWFDSEHFFKEVKRVSQPHGMLSYWGYNLLQINEHIDPLIKDFHDHVLNMYWDDERKILLDEYESIKFPLINKKKVRFNYQVKWTIDELEGYLNSWSALQSFIRQNNNNPIPVLIQQLTRRWAGKMTITFPVFLIHGYVY